MAFYLNQLITESLGATAGRLFPPAGGTNASRNPAGALFVPTIVAVVGEPDVYKATFTPTTAGIWRFDVTDSVGDRWVGVFDVVASVPVFTRVGNQQTITANHINDLQTAIEAVRS